MTITETQPEIEVLKKLLIIFGETDFNTSIFEPSNRFNVDKIPVDRIKDIKHALEELKSMIFSRCNEYSDSKSAINEIISTLLDSQPEVDDGFRRWIVFEHLRLRQKDDIHPVIGDCRCSIHISAESIQTNGVENILDVTSIHTSVRKVSLTIHEKTILDKKSVYESLGSLSLTMYKSVLMMQMGVTKHGQSEVLVLQKADASFALQRLQILYDKMESALKSLSCKPKYLFDDDIVKTLSGRTPLEAERTQLDAAKFGTVLIANESMTSEQQRRSSFAFWSLSSIKNVQELVEAGFYACDHILQTVECFSCGLSLNVSELSDPLDVHRERSPHCQFLHSEDIRERTISSTPLQQLEPFTMNSTNDRCRDPHSQNFTPINQTNPEIDSAPPERDIPSERKRRNIDRHVGEVAEGIQKGLSLNQSTQSLISQPSDMVEDGEGGQAKSGFELALSGNRQNKQLMTNLLDGKYSVRRDASVPQQDDANNTGHIHDQIEGAVAAAAISNFAPSPSSLAQDSSTPPPRNPRYEQDIARRESFNAWNGRHDIDSLVEAGLFYTGDQDIVRCFHCDIGLAEWNREDDPWQEHARHSHECHFLLRVKGQTYVNDVQREWSKVYSPKRPDLSHVDSRLDTFHNWPRDFVVQTPEQLSIAGFYYAGETDTVRCHYCDGGLREWEPGDIPWVEHAKWFPHCKFVLKIKGLPFIQQCVARRNEILEDPDQNNARAENEALNRLRAPISNEEKNRAKAENNPLYTAAAQAVLTMGYSTAVVTKCINAYIANTGQWNFGASDLMNVILDKEDEGEKLSSDEETSGNETNDDEFRFDGPALVRINETLKQEQLCIDCRSRGRKILFRPCGHFLFCQICAQKYSHCSRCESEIKNRVKIFMS